MILHLDFETASDLDLRKVGAYRYAMHPETRIICMAWRWGCSRQPVQHWKWGDGHAIIDLLAATVMQHMHTGNFQFMAHNAEFEWNIWNYVLNRQFTQDVIVPAGFMECTAARARYWGLPGKLETLSEALDLTHKKDDEGHRLMMRMNKPRNKWYGTWWHEDDPDKLQRLVEYCIRDVEAEEEVAMRLPPIPKQEQELYVEQLNMNMLGVKCDIDLVERNIEALEAAQADLDIKLSEYTEGAVCKVGQIARLKQWFLDQGVEVDNCAAAEMTRVRKDKTLGKTPRLVAAIRERAGKSSVKKYQKMLNLTGGGSDRLQGLVEYYGAGRTGRYAGRHVQPQNLPRPVLNKNSIELARADIKRGHSFKDTAERVNISVHQLSSDLIRSALVPRDNYAMLVGDYAQIEARVLAWLAGATGALQVFRQGQDIYTYAANQQGSDDRQFGKVLVLACGYGMGWKRFRETAESYGVKLTAQEASEAVDAWRANNLFICKFWYELEECCHDMLTARGKDERRNIRRRMKRKHTWAKHIDIKVTQRKLGAPCLHIELPSGRLLTYYDAVVEKPGGPRDKFPGQRRRNFIVYRGLNIAKQWVDEHTYGGKLVENVTQAVARDVMAEALLRLRYDKNCRPLLTVHDELVCEAQSGFTVDDLGCVMEVVPLWATGLPVEAEVEWMPFYGK
jgi:DNA polymerase